MKRPKDMTHAEVMALPVYGASITYQAVDSPEGRKFEAAKVETPRVKVTKLEDDDILLTWVKGQSYTFGQYEDGTWFRRAGVL